MLRLMAQDATSVEIVRLLSLSSEGANFNYVSNIFTKLQVADQAQAVIRAQEAGLGQDRP
jgi:DNA-binding CsgD family transcriptional regulator